MIGAPKSSFSLSYKWWSHVRVLISNQKLSPKHVVDLGVEIVLLIGGLLARPMVIDPNHLSCLAQHVNQCNHPSLLLEFTLVSTNATKSQLHMENV